MQNFLRVSIGVLLIACGGSKPSTAKTATDANTSAGRIGDGRTDNIVLTGDHDAGSNTQEGTDSGVAGSAGVGPEATGGANSAGGTGGTTVADAGATDAGAPVNNCPDGYIDVKGDGTACVDIDECATDNGGCGDATRWVCTNKVGAAPTCKEDACSINNGGCGGATWGCANQKGAAPLCWRNICPADRCVGFSVPRFCCSTICDIYELTCAVYDVCACPGS